MLLFSWLRDCFAVDYNKASFMKANVERFAARCVSFRFALRSSGFRQNSPTMNSGEFHDEQELSRVLLCRIAIENPK